VARFIEWAVRAEAYRRLAYGESTLAVESALGVDRVTVGRWGRLVGMRFLQGRDGGIVDPLVPGGEVASPPGRYRRLTLADRSFIQAGLALPVPLTVRAMAAELGVAPSTVSREIGNNRVRHRGRWHYSAEAAHWRALRARPRRTARKLDEPRLRAAVVARLNLRFSPEQVAGQLRVDFADEDGMRVSHETIYQALYVQGKGALRHELSVEKALRSGRTGRVPRSKLPARGRRPWLDGARLSDRPAEAADRAVPGNWEGDLVVGPNNSGIITLVERNSRFTLLGRLPGLRDSATVTDVLAGMIEHLPDALTKSITWDQGVEMAYHADFTVRTGCPVFFCDPHSPWQRGTNENTNGLIRDFYPKGTDFNQITDADLAETQRLLNLRPRKTLNYQTPAAILDQHIRVALAA